MSQHFDFQIACDLSPSVPEEVIETLRCLFRDGDAPVPKPPDDDFFKMHGWQNTFQFKHDATHFPGELHKSFRRAYRYTKNKVDHFRYTLSFRCYMLDDQFFEVFYPLVKWLARNSDAKGFVGYFREEFDWWPTLLFFQDGEVYLHEAKEEPTAVTKSAPPWAAKRK